MEIDTNRIDLEKGAILHQGVWLTADDLKVQIQEKMASGDMKFANLASLLEELNTAVESAQVVETKFILSKDQYEELSLLTDGKINDGVRKAVLEFIEGKGAGDTSAGNAAQEPSPESPAEAPSEASDEVEFVVQNGEIENPPPAGNGAKGKMAVIKCSKCGAPIEIDTEAMPSEVRCSSCHARGVLKTHPTKPRF